MLRTLVVLALGEAERAERGVLAGDARLRENRPPRPGKEPTNDFRFRYATAPVYEAAVPFVCLAHFAKRAASEAQRRLLGRFSRRRRARRRVDRHHLGQRSGHAGVPKLRRAQDRDAKAAEPLR